MQYRPKPMIEKNIFLNILDTTTVLELKNQVRMLQTIPETLSNQDILMFYQNDLINDNQTLQSLNMTQDSAIDIVFLHEWNDDWDDELILNGCNQSNNI